MQIVVTPAWRQPNQPARTGRGLQLLPGMVSRGTRSRTFQQIHETLDDLDSELASPTVTAVLAPPSQGFSLALETSREKLTPAWRSHRILREPSYPADQLRSCAKRRRPRSPPRCSSLRSWPSAPWPVACASIRRRSTLCPRPRRAAFALAGRAAERPGTPTPRPVRRAEVTLALVGDFDPSAVTEQLQRDPVQLPCADCVSAPATPYQPHASAVEQIQVPDKARRLCDPGPEPRAVAARSRLCRRAAISSSCSADTKMPA